MLNINEIDTKIRAKMTVSGIKKTALDLFWKGEVKNWISYIVMTGEEFNSLTDIEKQEAENVLNEYQEELKSQITCPYIKIDTAFACDDNFGLCMYIDL